MKKFAVLFLLSFCYMMAFSQSQAAMNKEANDSLKAADKQLNILYQKILVEYKADTAFIQNLKKAQRLWVQFRDAEMDMKYPQGPEHSYGSVLPMCWAMYKTGLTKDRIKTLQVWLDGIEEGDVCNGSVKSKP